MLAILNVLPAWSRTEEMRAYLVADGGQVLGYYNVDREKERKNPVVLDKNWKYQCDLSIFNIYN